MRSFSVARCIVAAIFGVTLLGGATAQAQKADDATRVNFDTADGVKLQGYFWPGNKGGKSPTVLLLHNFDTRKGGTAFDDGWDDLAKKLAAKGYSVLAFDFRGHGGSTTINKEFWTVQHNRVYVNGYTPNPTKQPVTIAYTSFKPGYYNYFVNDIVAARAYLDSQNDAKELNVSQLIVIGAGEGATLGAMWMASEWHRKLAIPPKLAVGVPQVRNYMLVKDNFEGADQTCCVWLSMSPTLAGSPKPLTNWLVKTGGGDNKVPMCFVYGDKDKSNADKLAQAWLGKIVPGYDPKANNKAFEFTGEKAIPSTLSGSKLLDPDLGTTKFIIESYIEPLVAKKGQPAWRPRDYGNKAYLYVFQTNVFFAKVETEMMPRLFPLQAMGVNVTAE